MSRYFKSLAQGYPVSNRQNKNKNLGLLCFQPSTYHSVAFIVKKAFQVELSGALLEYANLPQEALLECSKPGEREAKGAELSAFSE